ncbi:2'-5' RNA ligase family protein [Algoriphagus sp. D3-2-R+10]|uniref:2'-5' RNA ligase family protein n=1 Tax=Algoriphagus aurantiacus TaxID=3103948 RepID=UPI002B3E3FCE|nr:2'-5' RNA ligase family protein [Algoriphagus sp. D3-2-R+10]MEB2774927.1 2'-5' RNA ligase family protein [Algoriphagus sp. D3-2-R+10]
MKLPLYEYFLIISPNKEICELIMQYKEYFTKKYGCTMADIFKPHISIMNCLQSNHQESQLIENLNRFGKSMEPFTVQLNGIGQFEKTVFIDVANKNHLVQIITELSQSAKPLLYRPQFHKTPHISIAREMTPEQHALAWADWQNHEIKASFEVREVTLLRRPHTKRIHKFDTIATIPFTAEEVALKQLNFEF